MLLIRARRYAFLYFLLSYGCAQNSPTPPAPTSQDQVTFNALENHYQLHFAIPSHPGAGLAVIKDGPKWVFVFDAKIQFSLPKSADCSSVIQSLNIVDIPNNSNSVTLIELVPKPDIHFIVQKDDRGWGVIFSFIDDALLHALTAKKSIKISHNEQSLLIIHPVDLGHEVYLTMNGRDLYICPTTKVDGGLYQFESTPNSVFMETKQGFACQILSPDLFFENKKSQLYMATKQRPKPNPESNQKEEPQKEESKKEDSTNKQTFFYGGSGKIEWNQYLTKLVQKIRLMPSTCPLEISLQRLWIEVALTRWPEALSALKSLSQDYPGIEYTPCFMILEGMSNFLEGHPAKALENWDLLTDTAEILCWKHILSALVFGTKIDRSFIKDCLSILTGYPPLLRDAMLDALLKAVISNKDIDTIDDIIAQIETLDCQKTLQDQAQLYQAKILSLNKKPEDAIAIFKKLGTEESENKVSIAIRQEADYEFLLYDFLQPQESRQKSQEDILREMSNLRLTWKSNVLDYRILHKLAELSIQKNDYIAQLEYLKLIKERYPERAIVNQIDAKMQKAFESYFKQDLSVLSPLRVISTYQKYRDYLPMVAEEDGIIQIISDQFIRLDLLDQAADLLTKFASKKNDLKIKNPKETNVLLIKIADIHLLEKKYEEALVVLKNMAQPQDDETSKNRSRIMATALAAQGKTEDAIKILSDIGTVQSLELLGNLLIYHGAFDKAAEILSKLDPLLDREKDAPLKKESILKRAMIYYRSNQYDHLKTLAALYNDYMADNQMFLVLTNSVQGNAYTRQDVDVLLKSQEAIKQNMDNILNLKSGVT
ncbi:MAG: hypothetical protein NTX76_03415 [Alphaproteobacteria bacterium]|nr:hypothetical protein [Alphaproteobacteria bacterium]